MSINISAFRSGQTTYNILKTGETHLITTTIDMSETNQEKIDELFYCLSQALSSSPAPFKDMCITAFKAKIFSMLPTCRAEILNTINSYKYKDSEKLAETIEKINYLVKDHFFSDARHLFLLNTRFSHHLHKTLGDLNSDTTTRGMTYLIAGLGFIATGGFVQLFSTGYPSQETTLGSTPAFAMGGSLVLVPFIHAAVHARKDIP